MAGLVTYPPGPPAAFRGGRGGSRVGADGGPGLHADYHSPCGLINGRDGKQHTRPRFRHEFLPLRVDPSLRQNHSTPSLHPHYQVSTLLWVDPTLGHALVLSPSGVFPLWLSLDIVMPGSHVPRES